MGSLAPRGTSLGVLRFLDFPKEIRDKIYSELLLAEKIFSKTSNKYRFPLTILKINRQINAEAYEVLYKANQWIKIQEEERSLRQALVQLCIPFIPLKRSRCFYHDPAMVLTLRCPAIPTITPKKRFEWSYLVTADRFQDICLAISIAQAKARVYVRISFSFHKQCRDNRRLQNKLLHSLCYLPGFKIADATGLNPAPLRLNIIHDLTSTPSPKMTDSELSQRCYELEGDLCYQATTARGLSARDNLTVNSKLATKKYNQALAGTISLHAQLTAEPQSRDSYPFITSTVINDRLLPLVSKLGNTAAGYRVKDNEGLISLRLLASLLKSHHLTSTAAASTYTSITEIARGRRDYSLAVYALIQAQEHYQEHWQEELKKPVTRLWKSVLKRKVDEKQWTHIALLYGRFGTIISELKLPSEYTREMLEGTKDEKAVGGNLRMEVMREAEEKVRKLGSSGLAGNERPC
ncbi:MAG: hypothetical protein LQ337_003042 [Flavoplaca oasis]|nr:MAG: hypothetical protein LQ337_003042 [Flavoplaca oasis]